MRRLIIDCAIVSFGITSSALAGDVFVVSPVAGSGVDFTSIQAAVDACVDGDIVLVRTGDYAAFQIASKGITIAADAGNAVVVQGETLVHSAPAGATVGLMGLQFNRTQQLGSARGLVLSANAGAVLVQSCRIFGMTPSSPASDDGHRAVEVVATNHALFLGCEMYGGNGSVNFNGDGTSAGSAVHATASTFALYGCLARGGVGGSAQDDSEGWGGWGGDGATLTSGSFAFASGTQAVGGNGGAGDGNFLECGDGGNGGDGLDLGGGTAVAIGSSYAGGVGGPTEFCSLGASGAPVANSAALMVLGGSVPRLTMPALVREGQTTTLTINGSPGGTATVLVSRRAAPVWCPELSGFLVAPSSAHALDVGTIPASGEFVVTTPAWLVPGGLEGRTLEFQLEVVLPSGAAMVSKPTHVVVLKAGL